MIGCLLAALLVLFGLLLLSLIPGTIFWLLWNLAVPSLGGPAIAFVPAWALCTLVFWLTGGIRASFSSKGDS